MRVLVIDIGGTHVKLLATGATAPRKFPSGSDLTPDRLVEETAAVASDWVYDAMSVGHLPYRKGTCEDYVGARALARKGRKKWTRHVTAVVELLRAALEPDEVLLGGGNAKLLRELPDRCRRGGNADAFVGGFRLWDSIAPCATAPSPLQRSNGCSLE